MYASSRCDVCEQQVGAMYTNANDWKRHGQDVDGSKRQLYLVAWWRQTSNEPLQYMITETILTNTL